MDGTSVCHVCYPIVRIAPKGNIYPNVLLGIADINLRRLVGMEREGAENVVGCLFGHNTCFILGKKVVLLIRIWSDPYFCVVDNASSNPNALEGNIRGWRVILCERVLFLETVLFQPGFI